MLFIKSIKIIFVIATVSLAQTGLWTGSGKGDQDFRSEIMFHAELGHWMFELTLRLRRAPDVDLVTRTIEGTYKWAGDSTIICYTEKLFTNGFPVPLNDSTKAKMTYSFIQLSDTAGGFGIVKNGIAYRMYTLYKKDP